MAKGTWGGSRPGAGRPPVKKQRDKVATRATTKLTPVPGMGTASVPTRNGMVDYGALRDLIELSAQRARRGRREPANPFKLPDFPPNAVPENKDLHMAADDAFGWGATQYGNALAAIGAQGLEFLGYPFLSELAQRPEYRIISETIATEMTRKWIKFEGTGDEDKTEKIKDLTDFMEHLKVIQWV